MSITLFMLTAAILKLLAGWLLSVQHTTTQTSRRSNSSSKQMGQGLIFTVHQRNETTRNLRPTGINAPALKSARDPGQTYLWQGWQEAPGKTALPIMKPWTLRKHEKGVEGGLLLCFHGLTACLWLLLEDEILLSLVTQDYDSKPGETPHSTCYWCNDVALNLGELNSFSLAVLHIPHSTRGKSFHEKNRANNTSYPTELLQGLRRWSHRL